MIHFELVFPMVKGMDQGILFFAYKRPIFLALFIERIIFTLTKCLCMFVPPLGVRLTGFFLPPCC